MYERLTSMLGSCVILYASILVWLNYLFGIDTSKWLMGHVVVEKAPVALEVSDLVGLAIITLIGGVGFISTIVVPGWRIIRKSLDDG